MNDFKLVSLILASISLIFDIVLIAAHIIVPKMRMHPGHLIFLQAFFQTLIDAFYILISTNTDLNLFDNSCYIIGLISHSTITQADYYFAILSIEVYIEIKKKVIGSHTNRYRLYYAISFVVFSFFIVFGVLTDSYGESRVFSCYIKDSSILDLISEIYFITIVLILWALFILSFRIYKNASGILKKHLTIIGVCALIETLSIVRYQWNFINDDHVVIIFLSTTGFFISLLRLSNKALLREIQSKLSKKNINFYGSYIEDDSCNGALINFSIEPLSLGNYFEINSIRVLFI